MSLEHGAPTKLYEDDAFKHLFSDVAVVQPEDSRYQWDQPRGVVEINGQKTYFVPTSSAPQSGETVISQIERARRSEIIKAEGLGIFPAREQLRVTRARALFGAAAIAAVCSGIGAAYLTDPISQTEMPNYASDTSDTATGSPEKKPSASKKPESRPENPAPVHMPVVVYENYSPAAVPSVSVSELPKPERTASPTKTSPQKSEQPALPSRTPETSPTPTPVESNATPPVETSVPVPEETSSQTASPSDISE